jgi:hypothetical protein
MVQQCGDGLHGAQQAQLLRLVEARQISLNWPSGS